MKNLSAINNEKDVVTLEHVKSNFCGQVTVMPTASADYADKIMQFVGEDTEDYSRGYFYLCKEDTSTTPHTYAWAQIYVQPSSPIAIGDTLNQDSGELEANIGGIQTQQLNYVTRAAGSATPTSTDKVVMSNMTYTKPRDYGQQAYVRLLIDGVMRGAFTIPYAEQTSSYSKTFSEPYEGITGMFVDFNTPSNSYYVGTLDTSKTYGMEIQQIYVDNLERTAIDAHWLPLNWNQFVINSNGGISLRDSLSNECLPLSGGTMSGEVDMDSNSIVNLPAPSDNGDAVNKDYVDNTLDGYLPLTGGTMTGSLVIKEKDEAICMSVDNSYCNIVGGTSHTGSPRIQFNGKSRSTKAGQVELIAADGTNETYLKLNPDGTATWGGSNLIVAGGAQTLTGAKTFSANLTMSDAELIIKDEDEAIRMAVDDSFCSIVGGTSHAKTPRIQLNGKSRSTKTGLVELIAADGTNEKYLKLSPDGTATWGGDNVVTSDFLTLSATSGTKTFTITNGQNYQIASARNCDCLYLVGMYNDQVHITNVLSSSTLTVSAGTVSSSTATITIKNTYGYQVQVSLSRLA